MRTFKTETDQYILGLSHESSLMELARAESQLYNKEGISLSAVEGALLRNFACMVQAAKVVEIGTLTGLSALYLLEGMAANGTLWTLEKEAHHAQSAQKIFAQWTGSQKIHLLEGDARENLSKISSQGPFDLIFIDANKAAYMDYFKWADAHLRKGGVIVADNVFLSGAVWGNSDGARFSGKQVEVMKQFNSLLMSSANYRTSIIPTSEGLLLATKI